VENPTVEFIKYHKINTRMPGIIDLGWSWCIYQNMEEFRDFLLELNTGDERTTEIG
jgi:hypothetical protein